MLKERERAASNIEIISSGLCKATSVAGTAGNEQAKMLKQAVRPELRAYLA